MEVVSYFLRTYTTKNHKIVNIKNFLCPIGRANLFTLVFGK